MSSIDFAYLADRERAIPLVAKWYFEQWGHLIEDETLDRSTDRMRDYLNRAEIPFILLALDHEEIVGAAQLKYYEMRQTFPDRKHWLGGVYVAPGRRGAGLGSRTWTALCQSPMRRRDAVPSNRAARRRTLRAARLAAARAGRQPRPEGSRHGETSVIYGTAARLQRSVR